MEKFLQQMQVSHNYSDYQIKVIRYFILTMASEISKLIIIFTFFACVGRFTEGLVCVAALVCLRQSGGGFHCEHYITCLFSSFLLVTAPVFLAELITPNPIAMAIVIFGCIFIAYKMVPVVSYHRPKPTKELIEKSRRVNFTFLALCLVAVTVFYTNHYIVIIFWLCVLHSAQLLITNLDKGGKYYVI